MPGSMRRFSGTLEHPPPRQNPMDRRHSNASDTSLPDTSHVRQLSQENVEYIPTRLTKVTAPKPAANPLQFIKVGPASLYKSAQEQLKKVEEIKKVKKEVRDEAEDWQSNLDNWKSSRRKRQEHIIERVVEVKKIEMEEYDRNRRRSKTFSEMMEERNSRGRKTSLVPVLYDDDANDLSDLGISASSGRNFISDGYDHDNHQNNREKEENDNHNYKQGNNGHIDDDGSSATTFSSPEPEEYTYERAIQGYVNYAETRAKSRTPATKSNKNNSRGDIEETETEKLSNGHGKGLPPSPPHTPRRQSAAKIEEKLSALEKRRRSSTEINNSVNKDLKMPLAKGEILKRRAMFELANDLSEFASKPMRRLSSDSSSKTKQCNKANSADSKENNRLSSGETSPIKEKPTEKATNGSKKVDSESKQRLSNGDLSSTPTVQERLSNLEKQSSVTERKEQISENCVSESIKDRLSNLDSSCNKETNRKVTPDRDPSFQAKLANFKNTDEPEKVLNGIDNLNKHTKGPGADSERSSSPEEDVIYETKRQSFHQSLDSLDVEGSSDVGNEAFERVHSLEDLDCCSNARNYPASVSSMEMLAFSSQSGDTDREDSGIHTADVSCSVSQADEPVEDGEIVATINSVIPHLETNSSGADVYHLEVEIVNQKQAQSPVSVSSSVLNEPTEMSTAYLDVKNNTDCSIGSSSSSPHMEGELIVNQPTYSKNNVVSPRSLSSLSVVVEENEEFPSVQIQENSEHAETNIADFECFSLVVDTNLDSTQILNELSIELSELENSHVLDDISTPTNLINPSESSVDSDNLSFICYNNTAPNSPLEIPDDNLLELSDETFKVVLETDTSNYVQVHNHDPMSHPAENASSTDKICMQHPGPGSAWDDASTADVEVCEKIDECVQFPSHAPLDIMLKEPRKMEQDALISTSRLGPEESKTYSEKSELPNDSKATIVNSETTVINETINSKDCTDNTQLPSIENSVQHFHTEVREDVTVKPLINPVSEDEVFLPISTSKILPLELSSDVEIVTGLAFPLGPPTSTEPPKEKPPPPPTELNDEELPPKTSLKRLDSTKRIKKEIWRKRSDFLGIDGDDESYLEPELKVAPPPDMTTFLVEERRSEQQLYRQSICSETDSNHGETTESRDSGVELDRAHSDDWNGKLSSTPEILSAQHSRQNSDIYGTASITSEEDEIMKKEREIIEILEKEEQWRYRNNTTAEESDIGEKLAVKLHQLEQEKMRLEWERTEEENKRQMKENARREEELRLQAKEQELRQQESLVASPMTRPSVTGKEERIVSASGEALQAERERLQRENEELQRQKETLQLRENQQLQHAHGQMQQHWGSTTMLPHQQWSNEAVLPMTHLSLQDISMAPAGNINSYSPSTAPMVQSSAPLNYRLSLPDLQQEEQIQNQQLPVRPASLMPTPRANPNRRPPPPIPPAKPLRVVSQEQRERENSIRNSRMPSADSIPQHIETTHVHHGSVPAHVGSQPISRQTLQALSAVPRSRFIANDMWMQPKKKPENQRSSGRESSYNYQHWLIQEAEHRRITEQQQRTAVSPRKSSPPHPHTSHQPPWGTSQPQHRQEKPLPDAIIQTLTQRVQNRVGLHDNKSVISSRRRIEESTCRDSQQVTNTGHISSSSSTPSNNPALSGAESQEKMLSVSGKKKCSHCGEELGRGAAMIIESLRLFYHIDCFKCCVCHVQLGDGLMGTDVRVRNNKLHCHNCYSSDDGVKFSCV